jgi:hypothetical protein
MVHGWDFIKSVPQQVSWHHDYLRVHNGNYTILIPVQK